MGNVASSFTLCSSFRCLETSKERQTRTENKEKTLREKPEIAVNKKTSTPATQPSLPLLSAKPEIAVNKKTSLPLEIIIEILCWLPVKSVLRMKCVCKQWYDLITQDHCFIEKHMSRATLLPYYNSALVTPSMTTSIKETFELICDCNGLLLEKSNASEKYFIKNRSTRQILELPDPHKIDKSFAITFSFIPSTGSGCYKLVSVYDDKEETGNEGCEVLTIGSDNSWRPLKFPDELNDAKKKREKIMVVSAGEAVHCIRVNKVGTIFSADMVSLDLRSESFKSSALPKGLFSDWKNVWALEWNGSLSFADRVQEVLNVLVLEDYKKLKWSREKIVVPLAFMKSTPYLMEDLVPLFAKSGDVWFWVKDKKLMAYNIESGTIRRSIAAGEGRRISTGVIYTGTRSLVTLKGMRPAGE